MSHAGWCSITQNFKESKRDISLHDSWYFASFFIKAASIPSPSSILRISRGIGISLILANSEIFFEKVLYPDFAKSVFIGGYLSASCLSSWQIKHFDQSVLCFSWADKESRILFDIVTNNQKQKYEKQIDKNNWIKKWIVMYYRRYLKY